MLKGLTHRYVVYVLPAGSPHEALEGAGVESVDVIHRLVIETSPEALQATVSWMDTRPKMFVPSKVKGATKQIEVRVEIWAGLRLVWTVGYGQCLKHGA